MRIWSYVALWLMTALLLGVQLFVPPVLGTADNGDFAKLGGKACIGPASPTDAAFQFEYFVSRYVIRKQYCGSIIPSSAHLPVRCATMLARPFLGTQFDLRFLGAVYAALALGALALFLAERPPVAIAVTAIVLFAGAAYTPLFNSLYMDAAAFVFLLWTAVAAFRVLTRHEVNWRDHLLLAITAAALGTSKTQYALLPLCILPLFFLRLSRRRFPSAWLGGTCSAAIIVAVILLLRAGSPWYQAIVFYDGLFFKFLPATSVPRAELRQLGLGPEYDTYIGQHAYSPGTHMQEEDYALRFGRQISLPKMLRFLLTHPSACARALWHDLEEASLERIRMKIGDRAYRLGQYEPGAGRAPEQQSEFFTPFSRLKRTLLGGRPWAYLTYIVGLLALLWTGAYRNTRNRPRALVGVSVWTALLPAAFGPAFFDAVDTGRHLLLFNALLDLGVCALPALWPWYRQPYAASGESCFRRTRPLQVG